MIGRKFKYTYELVLRENPGRLGGWLWRIDTTEHYRNPEAASETGVTRTSFNTWAPTRRLAEFFGGRKLIRLKRIEAGEERSWKYQQPVSEDELESRRARKTRRNP